jgi:UDP-N-acetyl-D-mannosaminuronic acid dehydrogenase
MNISVVGGGGRVGLPMSLLFASLGHKVTIIEKDEFRVQQINNRSMPFIEDGCSNLLNSLKPEQLVATLDSSKILDTEICVLIIGTPVESNGNPSKNLVYDLVSSLLPFLTNLKLLMLRSTVYPGVTKGLETILRKSDLKTELAFCPERIAEGNALAELKSLPQIIGADTDSAFNISSDIFRGIAPTLIRTTIKEAEITKLFANAYRYVSFAIANEFFEICQNSNLDWERVWHALTYDYSRAASLPKPGFAAGPCLVKDTQQLNFFYQNEFKLGKTSLEINEGLPAFYVKFLKENFELRESTIGILGMTFKGDVDDFRSSLSFELKRLLELEGARVLCSDAVLQKEYFIEVESLIELSDVVIVATPHKAYRNLLIHKPLIDLWRITQNNSLF